MIAVKFSISGVARKHPKAENMAPSMWRNTLTDTNLVRKFASAKATMHDAKRRLV